ncbi:hypothetical protein KL86SPO_31331 [uncultured Sporomusa sp.]|uniref:Uncharacterized protein n=1 Tax=uncultured Sporomusa sp. TaxID=307249 RepID=A0A212LUE9_9FIRM|nr:hypothetical protein KL86SPO_31331 [uncultured Sporomusa sp.]
MAEGFLTLTEAVAEVKTAFAEIQEAVDAIVM